MKANALEELKSAEKNIDKLSYKLDSQIDYELPIENSKRTLLVFKKYKSTDLKYPRNYKIIKKESTK